MLQEKVFIITGAKGGLGSFVTEGCLKAGAMVAGVSRSITDSDFPHHAFRAIPAELTSSEAAAAVVDRTGAEFGRIDGLIHVLGGYAGGQSVPDTDDATVMQMLQLNLLSAFYMCRALLPTLREQRGGRIIAVGSRSAVEPAAMSAAYSASKAGLVALIRAVAAENMDRCISANIVLPGTMDTAANRKAMPSADFSSWVHPAQVANLIVALAGDDLTQVNGAAIPVYGRGQ